MDIEAARLTQLYIRRVLREVRANWDIQEKIRAELTDHIMCYVEDSKADAVSAVKEAIKSLGSSTAVGKAYNKAYAVYLTPLDWVGLVWPWLPGPLMLVLLLFIPNMGLLSVAAAALFWGVLFGMTFAKKSVCIYTCLLPVVYLTGWFFMSDLGDFRYGLLKLGVWIGVFSLSCLWCLGELIFSQKTRKLFHGITAAVMCLALFALLGVNLKQTELISDAESSAIFQMSSRLEQIAESQPECYGIAMPYGEVYIMDRVCYDVGESYSAPFANLLVDISLFVDDYDEFRGGDRRDEYLQNENRALNRQRLSDGMTDGIVDCSTLTDIDEATRREMAAEYLLQLAAATKAETNRQIGLLSTMDKNQLVDLTESMAAAERDFYKKLSAFAKAKEIALPEMELVDADTVNYKMSEVDIKSKCMAEIGFIIINAQNLSTERLTEIFAMTGYQADNGYFMDSYQEELTRYILLWYNGDGFEMTLYETEDKPGLMFDDLCREAKRIFSDMMESIPADETADISAFYSLTLDVQDHRLYESSKSLTVVKKMTISNTLATDGHWTLQKYRNGWHDIGLGGDSGITGFDGVSGDVLFEAPVSLGAGYYRLLMDVTDVREGEIKDFTAATDFVVGKPVDCSWYDLPSTQAEKLVPDDSGIVLECGKTYGTDTEYVSCVLASEGQSRFFTGCAGYFEVELDGKWRQLPIWDDSWEAVGSDVTPGIRTAVAYSLSGYMLPFSPGKYRLVKEGKLDGVDGYWVAGEFSITDGYAAAPCQDVKLTYICLNNDAHEVSIKVENQSEYYVATGFESLAKADIDSDGQELLWSHQHLSIPLAPGEQKFITLDADELEFDWQTVIDGKAVARMDVLAAGYGEYLVDITIPQYNFNQDGEYITVDWASVVHIDGKTYSQAYGAEVQPGEEITLCQWYLPEHFDID